MISAERKNSLSDFKFSKLIFYLIAGITCYSHIKIGKITGMEAATALLVPLGLESLKGDKYLSFNK